MEIINLILPLLFVSALLFGLLIFAKKFTFPKRGNALLNISIMGTQMIMPKKFISVVKVQDKLLVLGVSDGGINLLKEIPITEADLSANKGAIESGKFSDVLRKFIKT